jgi:hypothetical protein
LSVGCGAVTGFAPVTLTARFAACPLTGLSLTSRTVITMLVATPTAPAGTVAVVFAALG